MKHLVLILFLSVSFSALANNKFTTDQLSSGLVGKNITVCGKVAEITTIRGDTFINLDKPYPFQTFYFYANHQTLSLNKFYKTVCGTGVLNSHKGILQIKIKDLSTLRFS